MAKKIKVSVILTSYNHAKYLREAIDSVLHQTFTDFELIIWDDASTDESWAIIQSYTDLRIRAFRNEINQHGISNVNRAIFEEAKGEYIAIHHSDDAWEPHKLEKQVNFLKENPNIGAVFSHALIISENGEPFTDQSHFYYSIFEQTNRSRHEWLNYFFGNGNALCHPSALIRKACYDDVGFYRYGFSQLPDFDMWVRLCLKYEIYVLPEKLIRFRVRSGETNTSGNRLDSRKQWYFDFLQVLNSYRSIETANEFLKIFPTAQQYFTQASFDIDFALAMIALDPNLLNNPQTYNAVKLFSLSLLFELLNNPERAKKINGLYGFSHKDFIALTAKYDIFSVELISSLTAQIAEKEQEIQALTTQLTEISNSKAWKFSVFLREIRITLIPHGSMREHWIRLTYQGFRKLLKARDYSSSVNSYPKWILRNEPSSKMLEEQKNEVLSWDYRPLISVITYVHDTAPSKVSEMIHSLTSQTYPNWELYLINSRPGNRQIADFINKIASQDERIHMAPHSGNLNTSDDINAALKISQGEFVLSVNGDDLISPDLFYEAVSLLTKQTQTDLIYFDQDIIESNLTRKKPWFKPHIWSPELLLSVNYLEHSIIRRSLIDEVGQFDSGFEGAQDWDHMFRVTKKTDNIVHIPKVMYHQRTLPRSTSEDDRQQQIDLSQKHAIEAHLNRLGVSNPNVTTLKTGIKRVLWETQGKKVSIIIPNKDSAGLLEKCISSIIDKTIYANFEIVIVDNQSADSHTLEYYASLAKDPRVKIIPYYESFNYSRANNFGAASAAGDIFLFLNNDIEVLEPDWLDELVRWAELPEIGCVGTKLLFPDSTIQHAGVIIGMSGHAHHIYYGAKEHENGIFGSVDWYRNYMAVTGACVMIRRDVFYEVGGFNEKYLLAFSDVEICLQIIQAGYRAVYTPFARLIHHEGKSRGKNVPYRDMVLAFERMKDIICDGDPYFNPNLSYDWQLPMISREHEPDRVTRILDIMRSLYPRSLSG